MLGCHNVCRGALALEELEGANRHLEALKVYFCEGDAVDSGEKETRESEREAFDVAVIDNQVAILDG
ncbi:uncharacterized protein MONOS_2822 [Monocercomonoides exilis]|uniref:uncharacterized protein n=1 Tax=Monocercomonoides exilis TaxID=2049356 RepID=UPI003559B30F|nr:hypothetical protein MONOS_2822 [Monocercomonoides exilis]|eukprot:MONOS_2822.1-p1 / transcript=MONOS_2822.1 / gene=MONOS_2822 / organism=Monocercomonoides_exilis_PA203 / gene_product=unspecified product / transcript_product=unspecified product / location=Mono_scaffold00060:138544-138744(+) / protein_length=67 / sequence_SO=supercontig / SO=protein_coding / is_pseudo=false